MGAAATTPEASGNTWTKDPLSENNAFRELGRDVLPIVTDVKESLELLEMLSTPVGQRHLGVFARQSKAEELMFFFTEALEYQTIPNNTKYRLTKATQIFRKYCTTGGVLMLPFVTETIHQSMAAQLDAAAGHPDLINADFFKPLLKLTFLEIMVHIYRPFRANLSVWRQYEEEVHTKYNHVNCDDFDYMDLLGWGTFGVVLHVKKKSTGLHYAMKVQGKRQLLDYCKGDQSKLDREKTVLSMCNHPFLLQLDYAFQSDLHAFLVIRLVSTGTLQSLLESSPGGCLPAESVRFYIAETALGLMHLHSMGIMHRDLKPRNICLGEDGHVLLADMGSVRDFREPLDIVSANHRLANMTAHIRRASSRRQSVMGTHGYMAPEMVEREESILFSNHADGYSQAVDWWSLGVITYKLLTGAMPFQAPRDSDRGVRATFIGHSREYKQMLKAPVFGSSISVEAKSLVKGLLDMNPTTRLGCGAGGETRFTEHEFFQEVEWHKMSEKRITPPVIPTPKVMRDTPKYKNYKEMLHATANEIARGDIKRPIKEHESEEQLTNDEQHLFSHWHYISPATVKAELGIVQAMEELETNYKVQQLTGVGEGVPYEFSHLDAKSSHHDAKSSHHDASRSQIFSLKRADSKKNVIDQSRQSAYRADSHSEKKVTPGIDQTSITSITSISSGSTAKMGGASACKSTWCPIPRWLMAKQRTPSM